MRFLSDHVGAVIGIFAVVFLIMLVGLWVQTFTREEAQARAENAQIDLQSLRFFIFRVFNNIAGDDHIGLLKNFEKKESQRLIQDTNEEIFIALSGFGFFKKASMETLGQLLEISKNIASNQIPTRLRIHLTTLYLDKVADEALYSKEFQSCMNCYLVASSLHVQTDNAEINLNKILSRASNLANTYSQFDDLLKEAHKLENGAELVKLLHQKMSELLKKEELEPAH